MTGQREHFHVPSPGPEYWGEGVAIPQRDGRFKVEPMPDDHQDPRVYFAAERTLLAWIRTGLALMGFGFVVARFGLLLRELAPLDLVARDSTSTASGRPPGGMSLWVGTTLVVLGVAVNVLAAAQHAGFLRRFRRGEPPRPHERPFRKMGVALSALLAAVGLAMAVYLVVVG